MLEHSVYFFSDELNTSRISLFSNCKDREASASSADISMDLIGSLIPAGQRTGKKNRSLLTEGRQTPDIFTPSSKGSISTIGTGTKVH